MSKTFWYFKKTGEIRDKDGEWDGDEGFWFHYDVDDDALKDALLNIIDECYFENELNYKNFMKFMRDLDLFDTLIEGFEDELHDYFEEEAFDSLD